MRTGEKIFEGKLRVPLLWEMTGELARCLLRSGREKSII